MATASGPKTRRSLSDIVLAPLTLLERSRGRKRLALMTLYLVVVAAGVVLTWRAQSLRAIPDIGAPFDLEALGTVRVPDSENAMVLYRQAADRLRKLDHKIALQETTLGGETDWVKAGPGLREWFAANREALGIWRRGTELPESLVVQPKDQRIDTLLPAVQALREFSQLALLEGSRLEAAGDPDGAWRWYRGVLRSSQHSGRHGVYIQRLIGRNLLNRAATRFVAWSDHPAMTPARLRVAADDIVACAALTAPISHAFRAEYFLDRAALASLDQWTRWGMDQPVDAELWYNHLTPVVRARHWLRREPERSLRVMNLLFAGQLAQCDRPDEARAAVFWPHYLIFTVDAATPRALRRIEPATLGAWADDSLVNKLMNWQSQILGDAEVTRIALDSLRVKLAERGYRLDHGRDAVTFGDLVGPYLRSLPAGFEPATVIRTTEANDALKAR